MKKSQILAALALAFALGVVAPVAGALNASAIDHTAQSATCSEVEHVRKVVAGDATYKAMLKLSQDAAKYTGTKTEAEVKTAITTAMSNLQAAGVAVGSIPGSSASLADTKAAVNATNVANYNIYSALAGAIKNPVATTLQTFKDNVASYNGITGVTPVIADYSWANWTAVAADTNVITGGSYTAASGATPASIAGTWKFQNWALYTALIDAVDAANTFSEGMSALEADLLALGVKQTDIDATATPAARAALTANVAQYAAYTNTTNGVIKQVEASLACSAANEAANAYGYISAIATALKAADTATYGGKSVNEVADILLGATAPVTPTDPVTPDKPGEGDDNQGGEGDGKGDGVTTPDTGVIANVEGNATSTASIMAGIATALTAAGVGVVAFRNIRRNKKA